ARALAAKYQPGERVTVYYDPADPKYAVLRREVQASTFLYGFFGLMVSCVGLRMFFIAVFPVISSSNSRWFPWSYRVTWPDLLLVVGVFLGAFLLVPMLLGL